MIADKKSSGNIIDYVLLFFMLFIDYRVSVLSISDIAVMVFLLKIVLLRRNINVKKITIITVLLFAVTAFIPYCLYMDKDWFEISSYFFSYGKLMFYLFSVIIISDYIQMKCIDCQKILQAFMYLIVIGAFIQWLIVLIFGGNSWPLYSLGSEFFGIGYNNMFTVKGNFRARSFYSEPAHYSVHLSMVFTLMYFASGRKMNIRNHLVYIIGTILSLSVSGVVVMVMVYSFLNIEMIKKNINIAVTFVIGVGITVLTILTTDNYIGNRLKNTFRLVDSSGVVRTIGGFKFLKYVPFTGVGIGNVESFYNSLNLAPTIWFSSSGNFYNNILLAIISIGYIGAIIWLVYQWILLKDNIIIFLILMITHFAWGKFNVSVVWVFLMFGTVISKLNKKSEISNVKRT